LLVVVVVVGISEGEGGKEQNVVYLFFC